MSLWQSAALSEQELCLACGWWARRWRMAAPLAASCVGSRNIELLSGQSFFNTRFEMELRRCTAIEVPRPYVGRCANAMFLRSDGRSVAFPPKPLYGVRPRGKSTFGGQLGVVPRTKSKIEDGSATETWWTRGTAVGDS